MIYEDALNIYTDGSSLQGPRRGGIGIRFITCDKKGNEFAKDVLFNGYESATNNQMELQACIIALKEAIRQELLQNISKVIINTDSFYIVDNYKKAMYEWRGNKWYRRSGQPVLNAEQWKELINLMKKTKKRVEFVWVKGHSKDINNRAVDRMAKQSANLATNKPISVVFVRKKISQNLVEPGCVDVYGQRISIRIITSELLKIQKIHKYKYEVISKRSAYFGLVDIIFSDLSLNSGHSYYVVFNKDINNPRIIKVIREL